MAIPWCRPAASGASVAVHLALVNRGGAVDRLVGAETALAASARLVETPQDRGAARLLAAIELAPNRPQALREGRRWIALSGLARALAPGESFALTLIFERAGRIEVAVAVEAAPAH